MTAVPSWPTRPVVDVPAPLLGGPRRPNARRAPRPARMDDGASEARNARPGPLRTPQRTELAPGSYSWTCSTPDAGPPAPSDAGAGPDDDRPDQAGRGVLVDPSQLDLFVDISTTA